MIAHHASKQALAVAAMITCAAVTIAGPLSPPAGPPSPTMKTLQEVEPRTPVSQDTTPGDATSIYHIKEPGSYYLLGDIAGDVAKHAIKVSAANVTIDFRGFTISGGPGSLSGVFIDVELLSPSSLILHGPGRIQFCDEHGISAQFAFRCHVRDLIINNNTGFGVLLGPDAIVERITANANGAAGVSVSDGSLVSDCAAAFTQDGFGVEVGDQSIVRACNVRSNALGGVRALADGVVTGCLAESNSGPGFQVGRRSKVTDCLASANLTGFDTTEDHCVFTNCTASDSVGVGFDINSDCSLTDCVSMVSGSHGFKLLDTCILTGCRAERTGLTSFIGGFGNVLNRCVAYFSVAGSFNLGDDTVMRDCDAAPDSVSTAIFVQNRSTIERCRVAGAQTGIQAGRDSRVDMNIVAASSVGVSVTSATTLVVRNTVSGALTPYSMPGGGKNGAVVTSAVGAGPWDNFED